MMKRTMTFVKDLQLLMEGWGIDTNNSDVTKATMDFSCIVEQYYDNAVKANLAYIRSLPDVDFTSDHGEITGSVFDEENQKYIFVYANNTKLEINVAQFLAEQRKANGENVEIDEEELTRRFAEVINTFKEQHEEDAKEE